MRKFVFAIAAVAVLSPGLALAEGGGGLTSRGDAEEIHGGIYAFQRGERAPSATAGQYPASGPRAGDRNTYATSPTAGRSRSRNTDY